VVEGFWGSRRGAHPRGEGRWEGVLRVGWHHGGDVWSAVNSAWLGIRWSGGGRVEVMGGTEEEQIL
jgi:hypothetical protein